MEIHLFAVLDALASPLAIVRIKLGDLRIARLRFYRLLVGPASSPVLADREVTHATLTVHLCVRGKRIAVRRATRIAWSQHVAHGDLREGEFSSL